MKFGPVAVAEAEGAVLAHTVTAPGLRLRKAHRVCLSDIAALEKAGIAQVMAAVLEPGDLTEDEAAARLAAALAKRNVEVGPATTGRVNFHAGAAGVLRVEPALIDAINTVDPAITIATLERWASVRPGQMVATVKIIPFAVDEALVREACRLAGGAEAFAVEAFRPHRVGLIQSVLLGTKESVLDKTAIITGDRLARSQSHVAAELRVAHEADAIADAIARLAPACDMLVIFGASAVSDTMDAIPRAIRLAGGAVERTGMPVDPGNLLVLGSVGGLAVIGAPGCARSPKTNGFDWILDRLMAGIAVNSGDIAAMGVGGLLMEIPTRPQPREKAVRGRVGPVWGVLLAAGRSTRMGGPNKLLAEVDGAPMVRHAADRLLAAPLAGTVCVLGHQGEQVRAALAGLDLNFVGNPDFASGLSSSLKTGIAALPADATGVLVVLSDMPRVTTADLASLVDAFRKAGGSAIVRATHNGKRGNPVILPRSLFGAIGAIEGDTGARHIVESGEAPVVDVEIGAAASLDIDTPDDLAKVGQGLAK